MSPYPPPREPDSPIPAPMPDPTGPDVPPNAPPVPGEPQPPMAG
ncbi:hypothetical protein [Azospirillum sp. TSO22-1]|nr:hypothetical protein [Azospirillum sp. TSO22-1]